MIFWNEETTYEKMEQLRKENSTYNEFVSVIEAKLNVFIEMKNSQRLYKPKSSVDYKPKFDVNAIKMTSEEFKCLIVYLRYKYIEKVKGDYFCIKKKLFSNEYKIYTKYDYFDY